MTSYSNWPSEISYIDEFKTKASNNVFEMDCVKSWLISCFLYFINTPQNNLRTCKYVFPLFNTVSFGVRVSVIFHFMFVHYTFSSVWAAEWPPFGK